MPKFKLDYTVPAPALLVDAFQDRPGHDGVKAAGKAPPITAQPNDPNRYEAFWNGPRVSDATIQPATRSTASFRAWTVENGQQYVLHSLLELGALNMLFADPTVQRVQEQPAAIPYTDASGRSRETTVDFLAHGTTKVAIAVKPKERQVSSNINEVMAAASRQNPDFADRFIVRSEDEISKAGAHNGALIRRSRRLRDPDATAAVLTAAGKVHGSIAIGDLLSLCTDDGLHFAAAVNLIAAGILLPEGTGRITRRLRVRVSKPDPDCARPLDPATSNTSFIIA